MSPRAWTISPPVTAARCRTPIRNLTLVEGSIVDRALVDRAVRRFQADHVIHSAAAYKDPDDWLEDTRTNVEGTIHIVQRQGCRSEALRKFPHRARLWPARSMPIPATRLRGPFTSYGISKQAGESYLAMSGLPFVSLRLANVTGPRLAIGPIPTFYTRLKAGKGASVRGRCATSSTWTISSRSWMP